ncbi:leucine rich repeat gene family [Choristoneura biennis entomopoxvirus]|uniref:Leucine rich repeat gene family n=1 Tax=Choristoneura biennis entomopoxvirus TaxID=10288 RepID=A0A916KPF8_CBEPV|nr:leucine rich repeat gene family [Choristoneura biennis entomopoxvirus]CCU55652.1 leucine rich repeat gene family [Choristoneura biennis entomopoxvirus]
MMIINEDYAECDLISTSINLLDHQKRIIQYFYDIEKSIIDTQNNFIDICDNISESNLIIKDFLLSIKNEAKNVTFMETIKFAEKYIYILYNKKSTIYCLNDDVGSGKSYSMLGLIKYFKDKHIHIDDSIINTTVISAPYSLINQWRNYASYMNIKFLIINKKKQFEYLENISDYDLILVSNTFIFKFINFLEYRDIKLLRIIIDEPEVVIQKNTKQIFKFAYYKYIISSTYYDVIKINNITFDIKYIKSEKISLFIMNPIIIPIKIHNDIIKAILKINDDDETIIQMFDVDAFTSSNELFLNIFKNKTKIIKETEHELNINKNNLTLNQIKEIHEKINYEKNCINHIKNRILTIECNICFADFENNKNILMCCVNTICNDCYKNINRNINSFKCPYCQTITNNNNNICNYKLESKKFDYLKKLKFTNDSKILIIGNYSNFNNIKELSNSWFNNTEYAKILKGNAVMCNNIFKKFKETNEIKILYFESYNKVYGYNMEYVTDIIILTELENNIKLQMIGRAQRLGRTQPLKIYEFSKY